MACMYIERKSCLESGFTACILHIFILYCGGRYFSLAYSAQKVNIYGNRYGAFFSEFAFREICFPFHIPVVDPDFGRRHCP